jgi:hypothetical protein
MTDRELELLYMQGCSQSQAAGLRAVFDAGVKAGSLVVFSEPEKLPAPEIVPPAPEEKPKPSAKKTKAAKTTKRGRR